MDGRFESPRWIEGIAVLVGVLIAAGVAIAVFGVSASGAADGRRVLTASGSLASFSDVPSDHPYRAAIEALSADHVIEGFPDGRFKPSDLVMRQQFAKMIVLTLGYPVSEDDVCGFGDVDVSGPEGLYPDNYVAVAAGRGITVGVAPGSFAPWNNISRAQIMTMVVRAAMAEGVPLEEPSAAYLDGTSPGSHLFRTFGEPPHGPNAQMAEYNDLLWGIVLDDGGGWDPWRQATRGEVAQILWRLGQKLEEVPPTTTTTATSLATPVLWLPADGTVFSHYPRTVKLEWHPVAGAVGYRLEWQYGDPAGEWWSASVVETVTEAKFTIDRFVGAQPGRWRVTALGPGSLTSRPSGWWTFRFTR